MACSASLAVAAIPDEGRGFVPSVKEAELYRLIRTHPQQERLQMVLDPRLCLAARKHAEDTQRRKFFNHVNPDGMNANQRVLNEDYPLPGHYTPSQNYVESMAGSVVDTPADAVAWWQNSPSHATQVFGKSAFYREQVVLGIGHAPVSGLGYATYVFLSAPPPVGEQGVPLTPPAPTLTLDAAGQLSLSRLPAEAIFEVWKTGPAMTPWALDRTVAIGASRTIAIGDKAGDRGFFRLIHLDP